MFEYNICNAADEDIFEKQCKAIERKLPAALKESVLEDVDGSKIQKFTLTHDEINIYLDYPVGAVYIKSSIDLEKIFS